MIYNVLQIKICKIGTVTGFVGPQNTNLLITTLYSVNLKLINGLLFCFSKVTLNLRNM